MQKIFPFGEFSIVQTEAEGIYEDGDVENGHTETKIRISMQTAVSIDILRRI